jgi:type IV pilus assembly protein PilW
MMSLAKVGWRARGFSLVELMVAMVLGLILISAALQVFLGNRQTQVAESSVARVQEAGRLALGFIGEDLRLAGFYGAGDLRRTSRPFARRGAVDVCPAKVDSDDVVNVANDADHFDEFVDDAIQVYSKVTDVDWAPGAPESPITSDIYKDVRENTDLISVWYAEDTGARIPEGSTFSASQDITVTYPADTPKESCIASGDLVMLSSSAGSTLFKASNSPACAGTATIKHSDTSNCSSSLGSFEFDRFTRVMKVVHRLYFVKNTNRKNAQDQDVYSLYRYQFPDGPPQELVEGVEYLRVSTGQRVLNAAGIDSGKVRYVTPASADMAGLKALRVGVLVQGLDVIRTDVDTASYELLPGISITPDSGKTLRRVFSTSVELRNRAH